MRCMSCFFPNVIKFQLYFCPGDWNLLKPFISCSMSIQVLSMLKVQRSVIISCFFISEAINSDLNFLMQWYNRVCRKSCSETAVSLSSILVVADFRVWSQTRSKFVTFENNQIVCPLTILTFHLHDIKKSFILYDSHCSHHRAFPYLTRVLQCVCI